MWIRKTPLQQRIKQLNKTHIRQQDITSCGPSCLQAVLRHFDHADTSLERLRELSGTNLQGATLLGLREAARQVGLEAEGYQAGIEDLKTCTDPCILHIVKDQRQHYVTFYGYDKESDRFLIGDPAEREVKSMDAQWLSRHWRTNRLLLLQPTDKLRRSADSKAERWQWLRSMLEEDWNLLGTALALGIAVTVLSISTAVFSQKLIDDILPEADRTRLFAGLALLGFLLVAKSILDYLRKFLLLRQGKEFNIRLIRFFYSRLLQLPKGFFDGRKTGDLIARMNDTRRIQRTVAYLAGNVMIDLMLLVVVTVAIFTYDWQVGLLALLWIPVFAWVVRRFHQPIVDGQRGVMQAYAQNESNYIDTIQGIGTIKVNNVQPFFVRATQQIYTFFQQSIFSLGKLGARFGMETELVSSLFLIAILGFTSLRVLDDIISLGALFALIQMVTLLMNASARLATANIQLQEALVAFERMREFSFIDGEYDPEQETSKTKVERFEKLEVANLSFRYPGRKLLLENIHLEVSRGTFIAILGESGCGKSTLLQILQRFYQAASGTLRINGHPLDEINVEDWRDKLGVLPQEVKVFNGTLLDNILLGQPVEDPAALEAFFKEYGFDRYFRTLPNSYATLVGEEGINLSGGQRQLLALARVLYRRPQLLLLDEPTAALDRDTEQFVLNLLDRLKDEMGILLLTHRLSTARRADRIYIIENGEIVDNGRHHELLGTDNLYSRSWYDLTAAS